MKCSKPRSVFRPRVEQLESRLQPGSLLTGSGYGWSLLADNLSILNAGSFDSHSLDSQTTSESSKTTQSSTSADVPSDNFDIAVISVAAARNGSSGLPSSTLVDTLSAGLSNENLSNLSLTGNGQVVPLAAATIPTVQQESARATPNGSVPQSPIGVATPTAPLPNASSTPRTLQATIAPAPDQLAAQVVAVAPLHTGPKFHVTTQSFQNSGIQSYSVPVWASYLGFTGDDRLLGVAVDPNLVASQPVVVVGFSQNPSDSTDFRGLIARFNRAGTQATILTLDMGSNSRTEIHSAVVDPTDGAIYVSGQVTQNGATTDLIGRINSLLSNVDWMQSHTATISATGNSVHLDSLGTSLYATGGVDGTTYVTKLTNLAGPPTMIYDAGINFTDGPSVGNGVAPDSAGNADLAIQIQASPDAIPAVAQVNATGTAVNWSPGFNSMGPNGTMNSVYVDSSDNVFVTGGIGITNPPLLDELIASFDSFGNPLGSLGIAAQGGGQVIGYGIQTDASGNVFTGVTSAGRDLVGNMGFLKVDPTLNRLLEYPGQQGSGDGQAYGALDDQVRAFILDLTTSSLYLAGFTNSTDFNFTTGAYQSTYGGGPWDGVVIGYTVF